ncbi:MAG: hypothetical protein H6713_02230 [Myxococcales bacterium]|nr:hypothetical protein [Myxococcales bacterium]
MTTSHATPRRLAPHLPALLGVLAAISLTAGCAHKGLGTESRDVGSAPSGGHYSHAAPSSSSSSFDAPAAPHAEESYGGDLDGGFRDDAAGELAEDSAVSSRQSFEPEPRKRPGLGTSYGEHRWSEVRSVSFQRGNAGSPDAVLSMRYNDHDGVRDLASARGSAFRSSAAAEVGPFRMTLLDGSGRSLQGAIVGGETYAVGEPGQRYMIGIENNSGERYEVVTTVDGLDVIDGDSGSFDKRGYVVEPFTSFVIEGWRTSDASVAAFRFSSMDDSYAGRTGRPRNIGVIGAAFFHERSRPDYNELRRRDHADPFPGR